MKNGKNPLKRFNRQLDKETIWFIFLLFLIVAAFLFNLLNAI